MAYARVYYTGDAVETDFSVPFAYIAKAYVEVRVTGVLQTLTTDYIWLTDSTIQFVVAPPSGELVFFIRNTPKNARLVDFQDAAQITEADLDLSANQNFHIAQEALDASDNLRTVEVFEDGVDYTSSSTTQLTLAAGTDIAEENITVTFDGLTQHSDTWSLAAGVITFTSAIPAGVAFVQISYETPVTSGLIDGEVTGAKLVDTILNSFPTATPDTGADYFAFTDTSDGNRSKKGLTSVFKLPAGIGPLSYSGATVPSNWLECNGQAVSRTTYADLFAAISTTWGVGDGSTTFNLPPADGRVMIGEGAGRSLADLGGSDTHTLSIAQMPAHTHTFGYWQIGGAGGVGQYVNGGTGTKWTSSTGSGSSHNIMQKYAVTKMIISY